MSINVANLTESEAFDLFHQLKAKFLWAGTITSMGDVIVYPEGKEPWWDAGGPDMTDAMREAVAETYEWYKAIDERCAEMGNDLAPRVEVKPNGNFVVHSMSGEEEYTADGEKV